VTFFQAFLEKLSCHTVSGVNCTAGMGFLGGKGCLATCPRLCNRNQGVSTAIKHNVIKAVFPFVADEEHGFELAKMRNS